MKQKALREFQRLFRQVKRSRMADPTAMTLATADGQGRPSVRTVLLKEANEKGFVFYTNLMSRKSRQLQENPRAALCFFWPRLDRQVIVEGNVERVSEREADAYWKTRPRESQLGAWASLQSSVLARRATLLSRFNEMKRRFAGEPVPRPAHWSGYRVTPNRMEFWLSGPHRLHHRELFEKTLRGWKKTLLYP